MPDAPGDEYSKLKVEYLRQLIEGEREIGAGFDKTIITLSSGALGLSLAFIKDIAPPRTPGRQATLAVLMGHVGSQSCVLIDRVLLQPVDVQN